MTLWDFLSTALTSSNFWMILIGVVIIILLIYGNDPSPETTVVHVFDKGTRAGSEMAILFYSNAANTLWIYEWVE